MVAVGASDKCLAKLNGNTWSVSIASKSWSGSLTQHHQRDLLPKGMDCMSENREDFERYIIERFGYSLKRLGDGYWGESTNSEWVLWQHRQKKSNQ